jgi:hypothetical protein
MATLEKLKKQFEDNMNSNKYEHDMAVLMGSLGVSPKYFDMYKESVKTIKEF